MGLAGRCGSPALAGSAQTNPVSDLGVAQRSCPETAPGTRGTYSTASSAGVSPGIGRGRGAPLGPWGWGFPGASCPLTPALPPVPCSGQLCEMPARAAAPPGPCDRAECQNGASCVELGPRAVCQCPPGFGGPKCEKLLSVDFVDRDTYLQLTHLPDWPRANITLQVGTVPGGAGAAVPPQCPALIPDPRSPLRCPRPRTTGSCCTTGTATTWPWSCTRATCGSAMTPAPTPARPSTGTACPPGPGLRQAAVRQGRGPRRPAQQEPGCERCQAAGGGRLQAWGRYRRVRQPGRPVCVYLCLCLHVHVSMDARVCIYVCM